MVDAHFNVSQTVPHGHQALGMKCKSVLPAVVLKMLFDNRIGVDLYQIPQAPDSLLQSQLREHPSSKSTN